MPCVTSTVVENRAVWLSWRRPMNFGRGSSSVEPSPVMTSLPSMSNFATSAASWRMASQPSSRLRPSTSWKVMSYSVMPGRGRSSTGWATGQSSTQSIRLTNVSRPRAEKACVIPRGRMPSSTIDVPPSGVSTRSPWPVFWMGREVLRALRNGFASNPSNGPCGDDDRAMLTPCPRSVPPSAIMRYQ